MTLVIFIHFVSNSVWKWNTILNYSIYFKEEMNSVDKISIIVYGIKEKQLRCGNYFYSVFNIVRVMNKP